MKLKRVTAVLLAGVMAMGLVACGSGSDTAADTTTSTSTATDTADDSESSDLLYHPSESRNNYCSGWTLCIRSGRDAEEAGRVF